LECARQLVGRSRSRAGDGDTAIINTATPLTVTVNDAESVATLTISGTSGDTLQIGASLNANDNARQAAQVKETPSAPGPSPLTAATNVATTNPIAQTVCLTYVPRSGAGYAGWSHLSTPDKDGISSLYAHVPSGCGFPAVEADGKILFRVRMVTEDDNHIVLDVRDSDGVQRIDSPRDKQTRVHIVGNTYGILYPSVYVAATDANPPTTDKAFIAVTHLPIREPSGRMPLTHRSHPSGASRPSMKIDQSIFTPSPLRTCSSVVSPSV
jgi:hypothetical protein